MSKIIDLAKKLKALAEQGVGGEAINAQKMLADYMAKHNLTEADINGEEVLEFHFQCKHKLHFLLMQIYTAVVDNTSDRYSRFIQRDRNFYFLLTKAEAVEMELKFEIYSEAYEKEIKRFNTAFIVANRIFNPNPKKSDKRQSLTEDDYKILALSRNIERQNITKRIEK